MKVAVIGLGSIGLSHLSAIEKVENLELSAVCDINEATAIKLSEKYNVPYFTDYMQIPGNCDADAVILNLPHWLHCEATEYFLDNGFHVLVEKPMANTPDECKRMISAQKRSGKKLAVAHPQRFIAVNRKIKEIIQSGELGKLNMMTEFRSVDYFEESRPNWFKVKKLSGGGIVMNYGAHALDKILYLTESHPKNIVAAVGNWKTEHDIEGHAQIFMTLENGVSANITFSGYDYDGYENYYFFTNGALKVSGGARLYSMINREWVPIELPSLNYMAFELSEFDKFVRGEFSEIPTAEFGAEIIETIGRIYNG